MSISTQDRTPLRPRRNRRWIAAGAAVICLGGAGSAMVYTDVAGAQPVVRLNRTVYRGETLAAADVSIVKVKISDGIDCVPGRQVDQVIGQTAIIDLPNGSLMVPGSVGAPEIPAGSVRIGLKLAAGRLPVSPMPSGTPILLVPLAEVGLGPAAGTALSQTLVDTGTAAIAATVATAPTQLTDGSWVLDVALPIGAGETAARLAAADLLVIVRRAGA